MSRIVLTAAAALLVASDLLQAQRPISMAGRSTIYAPHAAVATSQPLASAREGFPVSPIIALEAPVGDGVRAALAAMGHVLIDQPTVAFGGAQVIARLPRGFAAGSDPRKDGLAVGY